MQKASDSVRFRVKVKIAMALCTKKYKYSDVYINFYYLLYKSINMNFAYKVYREAETQERSERQYKNHCLSLYSLPLYEKVKASDYLVIKALPVEKRENVCVG